MLTCLFDSIDSAKSSCTTRTSYAINIFRNVCVPQVVGQELAIKCTSALQFMDNRLDKLAAIEISKTVTPENDMRALSRLWVYCFHATFESESQLDEFMAQGLSLLKQRYDNQLKAMQQKACSRAVAEALLPKPGASEQNPLLPDGVVSVHESLLSLAELWHELLPRNADNAIAMDAAKKLADPCGDSLLGL